MTLNTKFEKQKPQPGNRADRERAIDTAAYRLKAKGYTTRQIAESLGIEVAAIKKRVMRGKRFSEQST